MIRLVHHHEDVYNSYCYYFYTVKTYNGACFCLNVSAHCDFAFPKVLIAEVRGIVGWTRGGGGEMPAKSPT